MADKAFLDGEGLTQVVSWLRDKDVGQYTDESKTNEIFNDYSNNKAKGTYNHAEGYNTQALGAYNHAEGCDTMAGSYQDAYYRYCGNPVLQVPNSTDVISKVAIDSNDYQISGKTGTFSLESIELPEDFTVGKYSPTLNIFNYDYIFNENNNEWYTIQSIIVEMTDELKSLFTTLFENNSNINRKIYKVSEEPTEISDNLYIYNGAIYCSAFTDNKITVSEDTINTLTTINTLEPQTDGYITTIYVNESNYFGFVYDNSILFKQQWNTEYNITNLTNNYGTFKKIDKVYQSAPTIITQLGLVCGTSIDSTVTPQYNGNSGKWEYLDDYNVVLSITESDRTVYDSEGNPTGEANPSLTVTYNAEDLINKTVDFNTDNINFVYSKTIIEEATTLNWYLNDTIVDLAEYGISVENPQEHDIITFELNKIYISYNSEGNQIEKTQEEFYSDNHASGTTSYIFNGTEPGNWVKTIKDGEIVGSSFCHAEGCETKAVGHFCHAEGYETKAVGHFCHAEGCSTMAKTEYAHAEGGYTQAAGWYSHAEGSTSKALGWATHSEGDGSTASGDSSHAEGINTTSSANGSHTEGIKTIASQAAAHAEGTETKAQGSNSHTEGYGTITTSDNGHAEGTRTTADGPSCHAEGYNTVAAGQYGISHAEGNSTQAIGSTSHSEGGYTIAKGQNSHAECYNTQAQGDNSHSEGYNTIASGINSHAEGYVTTASGSNAHAEGHSGLSYDVEESKRITGLASGFASHVEGYASIASGTTSHAEGHGTIAEGAQSHTEGYLTKSEGGNSHSEGQENISKGHNSHSEGYKNQAVGYNSHVEGQENITSDGNSHAEGYQNIAGHIAHVEGSYNFANDKYNSHVEGRKNTVSGYDGNHAQGYNNLISNGSFNDVTGSNNIIQNGENLTVAGSNNIIQDGENSFTCGIYNNLKGSNQILLGEHLSSINDLEKTSIVLGNYNKDLSDNYVYINVEDEKYYQNERYYDLEYNLLFVQPKENFLVKPKDDVLYEHTNDDKYILSQDNEIMSYDVNKQYYIKIDSLYYEIKLPYARDIRGYYEKNDSGEYISVKGRYPYLLKDRTYYTKFDGAEEYQRLVFADDPITEQLLKKIPKYNFIVGAGTAESARKNSLELDYQGNLKISGDIVNGNGVVVGAYISNEKIDEIWDNVFGGGRVCLVQTSS